MSSTKKKKTGLEPFLPDKMETKPVQGYVPVDLLNKVDKFRTRHKLTWSELITAMFHRLDSESKKRAN